MSNKFENIFFTESKWNYNIQIPTDKPVLVQQKGGKTCFACWHKTQGIVELKFTPPDCYKWDGMTYLMCIERWREIVPDDIVTIK